GDAHRLGGVVALRLGGGDLAEVAATGALVTSDEERGLPVLPALVDVGAAGLLAHGVQVALVDDVLQVLVVGAHLGGGPDPGGFALDRSLRVLRFDAEETTAFWFHCHASHPTLPHP